MKPRLRLFTIALIAIIAGINIPTVTAQNTEKPMVKKVLMIGDSMTGWLAERLGAYGKENGFEVATVIWDGSTINKWGKTPKLTSLIQQQKPDAVFISLGMNDLFETNPSARLGNSLEAIKGAVGDAQIIWVGPPSWPGYNKGEVLNSWLSQQLGDDHFFRSFDLKLPRQSAKNPHPTRAGMITWMDEVVNWVKDKSAIRFPGYNKPTGEQMSRGKTFIYKRMKETL